MSKKKRIESGSGVSVLGRVARSYCKNYARTGELCNPEGYFERIEQCKKCKKIQ